MQLDIGHGWVDFHIVVSNPGPFLSKVSQGPGSVKVRAKGVRIIDELFII